MKRQLFLVFMLAAMCSACADGGIKSYLQKPAPDEFSVITNQPLVVPPNFDLHAPTSQEEFVVPTPTASSVKLDSNDKEFLHKLGSKSEKGHVKKSIDIEHTKKRQQDQEKGLLGKTLSNLQSTKVVDPDKEHERIHANLNEGKPINEGEVPTKDQKTTLEKIFNY